MPSQESQRERPPSRRYRSVKRQADARATRERIRLAAESLFLRDGYSQTSMRAIAKHADVAEKTVYLAFPTKAQLLSEVIRVAVRGDDEETPITARKDWHAILDAPADEVLERLARHETKALERTARLLAMADIAAAGDQRLIPLRDRGHAAQRSLYVEAAASLADRGMLDSGIPPADAADTIYALTHEALYLRLTDECRWSPSRYAHWLSATLTATLTKSPLEPHAC
jgi:AcrR family transcriptional regulator